MFRNKEIVRLAVFSGAACGLFSVICFMISPQAGAASLASLILPFTAFFIFTGKRYRNITKLTQELNLIINGDIRLDVRDNQEGELSILRNEIYKVTSMLAEQASILKRDKAQMSDSLSNISHQLKTPLTSLLVMSELLEDPDLPPVRRDEFIANIRIGLFRMEWLALALLKIAKLDADAALFQLEECLVRDIVSSSVKALDVIISAKNQKIAAYGDDSLAISCDRAWTVEALSNIIKNASEYTPAGGEISLNWGLNPLSVYIEAADQGGGISDIDRPNLFRRFYKGANSPKESAGIGLALSLEIMRKQDGDIDVKNFPGKGASFILKFYRKD